MKRYKTNIKNKYIIYLLPFLLVFFFLISGIVLTWSGTALAWCEQGAEVGVTVALVVVQATIIVVMIG